MSADVPVTVAAVRAVARDVLALELCEASRGCFLTREVG